MNISDQGIEFIKSFEDFSPMPYHCPAGRLTIGYGHVIQSDETFIDAIGRDQATALLAADLGGAEDAINERAASSLAQYQFDALASLIFNIGVGAFGGSTLLRLINADNLDAAAQQFLRWDHINGIVSEGLLVRRQAEQLMFTKGVYHNH